MDTITSTYEIPAYALEGVQGKIAILNKRCRRLHIPEIVLTVVSTGIKEIDVDVHDPRATFDETGRVQKLKVPSLILEVTGTRPKLSGWEFAATIEHDAETGLNILRKSGAFKFGIPAIYRDSDCKCDHCNLSRRRNDTFICFNESTGEWKQIGRNCLRDFLGHQDPHSVVGAAEVWCDLTDILHTEPEGWEGGGGSGATILDLVGFIQRCFAVVRTKGWVSRGAAREQDHLVATVDTVFALLFPSPQTRASREWKAFDLETAITPADEQNTVAALEWVRGFQARLETLNDYEHNLYVACASDLLPTRRAGLAASLTSGYLRHVDQLVRQAKAKEGRAVSQFIGTVGERQEFVLTLERVITIPDNGFGVSYLHKFVDASGNQCAWFTGSPEEEGKTYRVTATVKEHKADEKWGNQTILSRCACWEYFPGFDGAEWFGRLGVIGATVVNPETQERITFPKASKAKAFAKKWKNQINFLSAILRDNPEPGSTWESLKGSQAPATLENSAGEAPALTASPISSTRDDSLTPRIDPREFYAEPLAV